LKASSPNWHKPPRFSVFPAFRLIPLAARGFSLPYNAAVRLPESSICRSCFRCGSDFPSDGRRRICAACAAPARSQRPLNPELSFRERQVVRLVSQAKLNKEIAYELHLSEGTIKEYLHRIFRKLGAANRVEVALWAVHHLPC